MNDVMRFYIVDDDVAIRSMLTEIIEDGDLGKVVGEAENGSMLDEHLLSLKQVDIVLIDLLMPVRDGIETIRSIGSAFKGKYVMISQVEAKELVAEAYSLGVEYFITKPINRVEVQSVVKKVTERIRLERSIREIHLSVSNVLQPSAPAYDSRHSFTQQLTTSGRIILSELGVIGEKGAKDLIDILNYIASDEVLTNSLPPLKQVFTQIARQNLGRKATTEELNREVKASQQRVRRTIYQALNHLASLGLTDFSNPTFERYATVFFDFTVVRDRMTELKHNAPSSASRVRINARKFIQALYFEAKQHITSTEHS